MKRVVKVRMPPTGEQAAALRATLTTLKHRFGLSAQPAIRVIGKAADSYAALRANIDADGKWFLHATVEAPEAPLTRPAGGFLGVDLGIVNIATSSDGERAGGARPNRYRKHQRRLRARRGGC